VSAIPNAQEGARQDRAAAAILDAAAHVLADHGNASLAEVASAAGVSRATLYRYYPNREALLEALAVAAIADAGARLADAGLERASVEQAIERIFRALVAIGDRYAVVVDERVEPDEDETDRVLGAPIRAVFKRGIETGVLRDDLPEEALLALFGGLLHAAVKLAGRRALGVEETAAAATAIFLDGARAARR
jgi:AcrR family transcriptional regulator